MVVAADVKSTHGRACVDPARHGKGVEEGSQCDYPLSYALNALLWARTHGITPYVSASTIK